MIKDIISQQRALAFDYLYDAVVVTDLEGNIIDWNAGSEKLYGYTKDEAIGQSVSILHVPDDLDHVTRDVLDGIARDGKWNGEVRMLHKDGTIGWIESMCVPLVDENQKPIGALGINRDITKRIHQSEQMLVQSRLAQMGEMLSMIAHQWRQPLGAISSITSNAIVSIEIDKLKFSSEDEIQKSKEFLMNTFHDVEDVVKHLSGTINSFRDFFKADKALNSFSLSSVFDDSLTLLTASLNSRNIAINRTCEVLPLIKSYRFELMQVVLNIVNNALDALEKSTIKEPSISLECSQSALGQKMVISNNGPHISEENLLKIFDPYFSTKGHNGTGLGLYMSKVIVEEHCNGLLIVKNTPKGVSFSIDLPLRISE